MSVPPNQSTIIIITVPRNSLRGWARDCLVATLLEAFLSSLLTLVNLPTILSSAMNALMMRSPPSVSSSWDIVSLHLPWASRDCLLSFFPTAPMPHAITGTTRSVNRVSCQLVYMSVPK